MMANEILKIMIDKGYKKKEIADRCGWSQSNFYNRIRKDDMCESDLQKIADALGCELQIKFIDKEQS